MAWIIPLAATPAQTVSVRVGGQACKLKVYQKSTGLFCDLSVNSVPIVQGALCLNGVFIVRSAYLGFLGDFAFFDTQGSDDPSYDGLGARWVLAYAAPA